MPSIFSLNLRFGRADDGPNRWEYRHTAYPPLIEKWGADFMCFQEVNDFQADFLQKRLPAHKAIGERRPAPDFWQSNIIFYHQSWRLRHAERFFLSHAPRIPSRFFGSRWPRQCTLGIFEQPPHAVVILNTHFDFNATVQIQSAQLLRERIRPFPAEQPIIITGDFNSEPGSPCHRALTTPDADSSPCQAVLHSAFTAPYPGTHHGFSGRRDGPHIDWILYQGDIRLQGCGVITEKLNGRYPSDHYPLRAQFTL